MKTRPGALVPACPRVLAHVFCVLVSASGLAVFYWLFSYQLFSGCYSTQRGCSPIRKLRNCSRFPENTLVTCLNGGGGHYIPCKHCMHSLSMSYFEHEQKNVCPLLNGLGKCLVLYRTYIMQAEASTWHILGNAN